MSAAVERTKRLAGTGLWTHRGVALLVVGLPLSGTGVAIVDAAGNGLSWFEPTVFLTFYVATGLGITVGFHRLFCHRSFRAHPLAAVALGVLGSMALQGPILRWVADHRRHHAHTDRDGDPHSPVRGFVHAHVGWLFSRTQTRARAFVADLYGDPIVALVDRHYLVWAIASVGLPGAIGLLIGGPELAWRGFLWGGLVRIAAFHQATWAVNSFAHRIGRRMFPTRDTSRNNTVAALLTFGEGWHNNHHAFPASARFGLTPLQVDVSFGVIRALRAIGLANDVRVASLTDRRSR